MALRDDLQDIYESLGVLTPAVVVDVARDKKHPLHSRFEWDDEIAGEAYRRQQAQTLIRSVRIRYVTEEGEASDAVRAFTSIKTPNGYAYEPTLEVVTDPLKMKMILGDMRREWQQMRRRYESYEEFWALVQRDLPESVSLAEITAP